MNQQTSENFANWMLNKIKSVHYANNELMVNAFDSIQRIEPVFRVFKSNPELVKEKYNHRFTFR